MMHTFANRAVGYFSMQVRSALAHKRTFSGDVNGCSFPPTAFDIPFSSSMKLPVPFHKDFPYSLRRQVTPPKPISVFGPEQLLL
jgi:hypothetical protein